jgi:two-component system cell cycle response regulator DivK
MTEEKKRIFYIEDNPANRLLVTRVLLAEGYEVITADNGLEGLVRLEKDKPHLILMDINMPELDGFAVTAKLRLFEHLKGIPIIALTANVMKGDREKTLAAGCDGYIQKPIDVDQFPIQIARYLEEANSHE